MGNSNFSKTGRARGRTNFAGSGWGMEDDGDKMTRYASRVVLYKENIMGYMCVR